MANTNNNSARQTHVSPGIYMKETELQFASKSLGITTLGLAGETVKGPAFQPILIENWRQFQTYFGSTNTEKFRGSKYPKYELPYIAQEYLKQSQQLQVCRVLGLSGVNAGPAWVISAYKTPKTGEGTPKYTKDKPLVIAVLRSRGEHRKASFVKAADPTKNICKDEYAYDKILYYAKKVEIEKSASLALDNECETKFNTAAEGYDAEKKILTLDVNNYGIFTLKVTLHDDSVKKYSVNFNPTEMNYIINVLGTNPEVGDCELYVEELYDVALQQLIEEGEIDTLGAEGELVKFPSVRIIPDHEDVVDLLTMDESMLTRKDVGKRYLYSKEESYNKTDSTKGLKVHISTDKGKTWTAAYGKPGHIYTVVAYTTSEGAREYYYGEYLKGNVTVDKQTGEYAFDSSTNVSTIKHFETDYLGILTDSLKDEDGKFAVTDDTVCKEVVKVLADDMYYGLVKFEIETNEGGTKKTTVYEDVRPITLDLNNYKEQYRYASTPWVVSELKGSARQVELHKLFRFHTISDGAGANTEVKVSIENIEPSYGTFDVVVRSFYDTDASRVVLERYKGCDLVPGSSNYVAYRIGSFDETYEIKSNYITVEVNEDEQTRNSIPAGFLGYPVRCWNGLGVSSDGTKTLQQPYLKYNTNVDEDIRITKQYFGLSDITGIDEDVLRYKGVEAYNGLPEGLTPCFHLDARIAQGEPKLESDGHYYVESPYFTEIVEGKTDPQPIKQLVSVDGIEGYEWVTVSRNNVTQMGIEPKMGTENEMIGTIYEDRRYRKFTMAFYGGFDGWDYYRTSRSNSDDFKYQKYRGAINKDSGEGESISVIKDPENYGFGAEEKINNSDYYAYLSAIRQFANPKTIDINVLATPGIDNVNNTMLVNEVIEMVEEERADSVYVMTTPDKPYGYGDSVAEMYSPIDAVYNIEESDIDSNYTCTFYPWVKFYDSNNSQYIYLPPTKDIVRNFAYTDNTAYPWFAAAGWNRGDVNGVKPKRSLKLEEQDTLYNGRINFINTFAHEGMKLWGDKNLQVHESQMNRISKRRLLLRIRKLLSIACIGLIFDPNDNTTAQSFKSAVKPVLDDIRSKRGITDWRLEIDDSQEARDRLELNAKIYLKLQPNLEYIDISFIITPSGTVWDNI